MKILITTTYLVISLVLGNSALGMNSNFKTGIADYKKTDFANVIDKWILLAENGNAEAQYFLGLIYYKGKGVSQDYKVALKWYTLAAEQSNAVAQYNLGIMYSFGLGVVPNYKKALKWYNLSSEQGNTFAQYNLGRLYYLGNGVRENMVYAHMWVNLASSNEFEMAKQLMELITELMTPSQIEEAERLARECVKKNYKGC